MIINLPIECPVCKHTHEVTIPTGKVKMVFRCIYVFINGILTRTITSALTHALTSSPKAIIAVADSDATIDEIRVSNIVRWTANFTPPTAPYTI